MNTKKIFLFVVALIFGALLYLIFHFIVSSSSELLLAKASATGESSFVHFVARNYLQKIRKVDVLNQKFDNPPIFMVLGGCNITEPDCKDMVDWLIANGADINAKGRSSSYELTVLHQAVIRCDEATVRYLLSKGADPNVSASGGRFESQTSLKILRSQVSNCSSSNEIAEMLQSKNGHE